MAKPEKFEKEGYEGIWRPENHTIDIFQLYMVLKAGIRPTSTTLCQKNSQIKIWLKIFSLGIQNDQHHKGN